jgi:hypothetical protein
VIERDMLAMARRAIVRVARDFAAEYGHNFPDGPEGDDVAVEWADGSRELLSVYLWIIGRLERLDQADGDA